MFSINLEMVQQAIILPQLEFFSIKGRLKCVPSPKTLHFSPLIHHSIRETAVVSDDAPSSNKSPIESDKHTPSASIHHSPLCSLSTQQEVGLTNGTPVETSSPASTSSLFNRLQLDDDLEADVRDPYADSTEMRDLFVTVDDPKKHVSTMETYITYRVSTKVCYWPVSW